jgi:hypothetical protein
MKYGDENGKKDREGYQTTVNKQTLDYMGSKS